MKTRVINLPNTIPPGRIIIQDMTEEVLAAITDQMARCLAGVAVDVVTNAREVGSYENRTGNLRRMITPNVEHAYDDPKGYPGADVAVVEADGKQHHQKQYAPPEDFDKPVVEEREDELVVTVAAIMPYAAPLEAKGYAVLTQSVDQVIANADEIMGQQIRKNDLTDRRTKVQRLSEEGS
jgi:hypothetical protein